MPYDTSDLIGYWYSLMFSCKYMKTQEKTQSLFGGKFEITIILRFLSNMTTFWLSEHILLSEQHNTPVQELIEKINQYCREDKKISTKTLTLLLPTLFPNIVKSKVRLRCADQNMKVSFRVEINDKINSTALSFSDIQNNVPDDWFTMHKTTTEISFGHLLPAKSNGQSIILQVSLSSDGSVSSAIANQKLDLKQYGIPYHILYTYTSVPAIFRSFKVIQPCLGYTHDEIKTGRMLLNSKTSRELITLEGKSYFALRSKVCTRGAFLSSGSCLKCKACFSSTKRKLEQNKENVSPDTHESIDETYSKLKMLAPNLSEKQLKLMESQIKASNTSKKGMRWDKDIISMSISIYNRNPGVYREIVQQKWLQLPSESLVCLYKNCVKQGPGILPDMMAWMKNEALRQNVPTSGYYGGIILDEMAIQEDLQIVNTKNGTQIHGLADSDENVKKMKMLNAGSVSENLANHVQQYLFNGFTGFRWPFANFPNRQADPAEIFVTTWKCIDALTDYGFWPLYCCMDGSSNNRAFLKMHFDGDPVSSKMIASYYRDPTNQIIFIMDPPHLLKKIRNSVLSSGLLQTHQRLLTVNGKFILWKMWVDAYTWDRLNTFKTHNKLTNEHIFPNGAQKMRNKLAFDCLNNDMLNLMIQYSSTLSPAGQEDLSQAIEFLRRTSFLVHFFMDSRPIKDKNDERLTTFRKVYDWFKAWENDECEGEDVHKRHKSLLTMETREDFDYLFHGFMSLVDMCVDKLHIDLIPSRLNSDIIENIFCQQRALYHGANTNPNYNEYRTGINSIILGQTTTSRKSNVGLKEPAKPFALGKPLM